VTTKADLNIDILNTEGKKIFNSHQPDFTGKYAQKISVDGIGSGIYFIKIQHNKKTYVKKLIVQRS
jgi:purine-nucleoside phosphorylase